MNEDHLSTETVKAWVDKTYGEDALLRDRAFCLAIEALDTVSISVEDSAEALARTLITLANNIYYFLKGQNQ